VHFPLAETERMTPERCYPVGAVFISTVATDPAELLGFGTWQAIGAGRVLVGQDAGQTEFDALGKTGGAKEVTLTAAQMPTHTHVQNPHQHVQTVNSTTTGPAAGYAPDTSTNNGVNSGYSTAAATAVNQDAGGGQPHPNLPPYLVVKMWTRTS
jgi:microcystin-dependent protein